MNKIKLSEILIQRREKNDSSCFLVRGVSRDGFIEPKQETTDTDIYNMFYINDFVFNPARMEINSIALNTEFEKCTCSSLYEIFYISRLDMILPKYLNLYFKRMEFARLCSFNAVGSSRNYFRFQNLIELEIELPSLEIQQKYVDIYNSLLENQKLLEKGLDDLKLVCDGYIESLKKEYPLEEIGKYLTLRKEKVGNENVKVYGVGMSGFIEPKRDASEDRSKYNIFYKNDIVYRSVCPVVQINLSKFNIKCCCSPIYVVFSTSEKILPEYLMIFFKREEFPRYTDFFSVGSARNIFDFNLLCEYKLPIPPLSVQKNIVAIYDEFKTRNRLFSKMKEKISALCPILIKGSLEEIENE